MLAVLKQPFVRDLVVDVVRLEQGNQRVDVKKRPHPSELVFQQRMDQLGADRLSGRWQLRKAVAHSSMICIRG